MFKNSYVKNTIDCLKIAFYYVQMQDGGNYCIVPLKSEVKVEGITVICGIIDDCLK